MEPVVFRPAAHAGRATCRPAPRLSPQRQTNRPGPTQHHTDDFRGGGALRTRPALGRDAAIYLAFAVAGAGSGGSGGWERDESSRGTVRESRTDGFADMQAPLGRTKARPPWLLKATVFSVMFFPPYMVLTRQRERQSAGTSGACPVRPLGIVSGLGLPIRLRSDIRARRTLLLLLASCLSYAHLFAGLSGASTVIGRAARTAGCC